MADKKISQGDAPSLPLSGTELVAAAIPPSTNIKPTVLDVGRPAVLEHVAESDPHTQYLTEVAAALAYQPASANLTSYATVAPSANVLSLLGAANYAAMRAQLDLEAGTDFLSPAAIAAAYQPLSANLTTYAGITPSANVQTFLGAADYAAMRTQLSLVVGTNVQAWDADLDTFAANPLTSTELTQLQNINANVLGTTQWAALASATGNFGTAAYVADSGLVHIAGTETISGAKTFTADVKINKTTPIYELQISGSTKGQFFASGSDTYVLAATGQTLRLGANGSAQLVLDAAGIMTMNGAGAHAIGNGGTDSFTSLSGGYGLKVNVTGATAALAVRRDGFPEVGFQSGGGGGIVGTFSNDALTFYTNNASRMALGASGGLVIGSPTGGNKGAGTLNATAVYDDNVLLTCYVFDAALDGGIDFAKWDEKVVDRIIPAKTEEILDENGKVVGTTEIESARTEERIHEPMRKFAGRLGGEFDPLDIEAYTKHWREKRHLTSMPNEEKFDPSESMATGAWIQRLIETVEIQAIHISKLNDRLKVGGL